MHFSNKLKIQSAFGVALAAASALAQAQFKLEYAGNTLQIGGRLNVSYDHTSVSGYAPGGATDPGLAGSVDRVFGANASRINFTFSRLLPNGITGEVFIDSSLNPTAGSGNLAGRENWLGATGAFGRLRAGRIDTPVKQMGSYTDVFYATGIADDGEIQMMGGEDKLIGFTRRQQKSLRYDSPNMSGFGLALQLGLPNADGAAGSDAPTNSARKGRVISTALTYASGPFSAGLGYEHHQNVRFTGTTGLGDSGVRLGAKYVFEGIGDIGAGANVFRYEAAGGSTVTRPFAAITGNVYVGSGKVVMRYGHAGNAGGSAPDGTVICGTPNASANFNSCSGTLALVKGPDSGARQFVVGYDYAVDKQFSVYGFMTQLRNGANANYNFGTNGYGALKSGNNLKGISVGAIYIF